MYGFFLHLHLQFVQFQLHVIFQVQNFFAILVDNQSGRCRLHTPVASFQKLYLQLLLQISYLHADSRVCKMSLSGGLGDATGLHNIVKCLNLSHFQGTLPLLFLKQLFLCICISYVVF